MKNSITKLKNEKNYNATQEKKELLEQAKKFQTANFYTWLDDETVKNKATGILSGAIYYAKDNIWTKNLPTTASSKILANFFPPENAAVIDLLNQAGAEMIGKTVLDELGMGGTGLHATTGIVPNPYDEKRIPGGSSSGSVFATAKELSHFALGTDTGDSIRKPASLCGVVGYKPTYGSISRYGVIPYAPSLDHVGFFANKVQDMFYLAEATFQYDKRDFTSIDNSKKYSTLVDKKTTLKRIGYFKAVKEYMPQKLWEKYDAYFAAMKKQGYQIVEIDFRKDLLDAIAAIYMVISFSEAVSTSANLDGINFGVRKEGQDYTEIMKKTRTEGFGALVKKRFIIGSYQLKKENQLELQLKAKQIRRLIAMEMQKAYEQADFIVMPPSIEKAKLISECIDKTREDQDLKNAADFLDNILILGNFTGMPSITIPFVTEDDLPIGINFNANLKKDDELLMFANESESVIENLDGRAL